MKTYKQDYELYWVSSYGSEWSKFTIYNAPEKNPKHKKNISLVKNHPLLKPYKDQIEIIKPL